MAEFEMPVEEQIRSLAKRFGAFETKLDTIDSRLASIDSRLDSQESRQGRMDSRQDQMDLKLTSIDSKLDSISVRLEDTRQIAKLGLEALEGLRESDDKAHAEMRREQPKRRRRS